MRARAVRTILLPVAPPLLLASVRLRKVNQLFLGPFSHLSNETILKSLLFPEAVGKS